MHTEQYMSKSVSNKIIYFGRMISVCWITKFTSNNSHKKVISWYHHCWKLIKSVMGWFFFWFFYSLFLVWKTSIVIICSFFAFSPFRVKKNKIKNKWIRWLLFCAFWMKLYFTRLELDHAVLFVKNDDLFCCNSAW